MGRRLSVAILGATGHLGKALTAELANRFALTLYGRRPDVARAFVRSECPRARIEVRPLLEFGLRAYDTVVNCIGVGDPVALIRLGANILTLTEEFDKLTLDYIAANPEGRLVSLSSGAVYGSVFGSPVDECSLAGFAVNSLRDADLYGIAKLASEAKHRAASERSIVDLRLFGFFSRHIDPSAPYLINDIVRAIVDQGTMVTNREDVARDYANPSDLANLVSAIIEGHPLNDVFDVYSAEPVTKFALLDHCAERYGLVYAVKPEWGISSPTGDKSKYFSTNRRATSVGYVPRYTSIESLTREMDAILGRGGGS